ncbi:ABC transporter ATP-binding protein [Curvibacter sp. CHRR-16]|uniref:ABC transporter ATP-binding protein n=1 Tax=Curvibacter sp. CHRR-16 TaxID=2835872 RepID=UPI001BD99A5D|nr:ABC transporter ATP-binding protein [Curvibacter sp. CHRR-16]MBT0570301.1 ABC transporter ATP-binding protein [Curvibacter sp. CHRR-16]
MSRLQLQAISKSFGAVAALQSISLDVPSGARLAVVGASGSGKTTLLRIMAGFEQPDSGLLQLGERVLAQHDGHSALNVPAHQRGIGYVPQDGALFPHLSVADNIGFGLPRNAPGREARIRELLDMVQLDASMLARRPHQLSGGQQQRVALARAMALQPSLMLLDEPFSALDTGLRAATRKAVATLMQQAGITTVLVTHDQAEALSFADTVAVMRQGRLVQVGDPHTLYHQPVDADTAAFLGDATVLPARVLGDAAECALGWVGLRTDGVHGQPSNGPANLLLRPEQIVLQEEGASAQVLAVDFGGSTCVLELGLESDPTLRLNVHAPSLLGLRPGHVVRLGLRGPVHVFPNR